MKTSSIAALAVFAALPAAADLNVRFLEGAPKDRFVIENAGNCALQDVKLEIDLGASAAGLILDTTSTGAGVEVYQPLELVSGQTALADLPRVQDGDSRIALNVRSLGADASIEFTIDVDDTKGTKPTMIADGEIAGAQVRLSGMGDTIEATFDSRGVATLALSACPV